ncbi:unnamed protein product [Aureobasidium mustum]|uniref:Uncharacterized protein n=1 Tax=Aureobasidium mustum TaxID=2773714 RepID=A0A9N8PMH4_9PEZI|nr:unnamed protein product [Aureobasidium mustum]
MINAQGSTYNSNITLRFFPESQVGKCGYSNSSDALTFTTESIPLKGIGHCFDLVDIFEGNSSQGFVNQTGNLGYGSGYTGEPGQAGIHWQVENMDNFDAQTNYSSVLYHQHNPDTNDKENAPGTYAARALFLYPGQGCEDTPSPSSQPLSWYGLSCWTEPEGTCGTLPYKIASFSIQATDEGDEKHGKCWAFAEMGGAAGLHVSFHAMVSLIVGTLVATWIVV